MLWTKNGSIPYETTDGTEGWQPAPDKPDCPEGKEVVWLNWEWVIRDPKPQDREGYQWNWNHLEMAWVELAMPGTAPASDDFATSTALPNVNLTTAQLGLIET